MSIADEAAGEFIEIEQENGHGRDGRQAIGISDDGEWTAIKYAVDQMFQEINFQNTEIADR